MCRFLGWELRVAPSGAGGRPLPSGIVTIAPALQHELLPPEVGMLLPNIDTNLELLAGLETAPDRFAGLAIGLFLSDPFLNVDLAIRRLHAARATWVAALPSACQHEPEFRQYLREVDLDLERELRVMRALSHAGLATIATISSAADAVVAGSVPTATLTIPDVGGFVAGYPGLAARLELEQDTSEAHASPGPLRLGLRLPEEEVSYGLDGVVLRPRPFGG